MVLLPQIAISTVQWDTDTTYCDHQIKYCQKWNKKLLKRKRSKKKMTRPEGLTIYVNLVRRLREDRFFSLVPLRSLDGSGKKKELPSLPGDKYDTSAPLTKSAKNKTACSNKACLVRLESLDSNHDEISSTNSPYGGQDVNSTSSSGPPTNTSNNKEVNRHSSSDDFRSLERKLEKERERRTHVDTSPPRVDTKGIRFRRLSLIEPYEDPAAIPYRSPKSVLGDDIPAMDLSKSNSFRANKKDSLFSRSQQQQQSIQRSPSYRNSVIKDSLTNIGPSSSSATL
ncbi:uncharacterized protein [Amphiura filiformis]|uniref:uncharacterized protein n=1 Tax=Amphiura filiformis TaxID=82378 RepID=UPI003B219BA6